MSIIKTWNLLQPSPEVVARLASGLGLSETVAAILANRGLDEPEAALAFLNPDLSHLHDPLLMRGMMDAVLRVVQAIRGGEKIVVWGDYDVDGVTGTTLLVDFLRRHSPAVDFHIPHRIEEGYGLDLGVIRRYAAAGVSLILTVDCGVSDVDEVREGRDFGVAFVITDHHEPQAELPPAEAVLNPRREGCAYPFKHLAGVGIAFKLAQAIARLIGPGPAPHHQEDLELFAYLDLVALGTVADIAPLYGENRILVKHGLEVLGRTPRIGLKALKEVAGIDSRPLRSTQIGFGLGPRINAAGRLDRADTAVELLLEEHPARARELANRLEGENRRRQEIEGEILHEAVCCIDGSPELLEDRILVLSSPGWHPGVIGIVASKLADRYMRPALLISTARDPSKGSARSIPQFDLFSHLQRCQHLLVAFGGHCHAAGLSIHEADIPDLRRELNLGAASELILLTAGRRLDIDATLSFAQIRPPLIEELRRLAPFGPRNAEPTFLTAGVHPARAPRTVGNNHLRATLVQKPHAKQFIGFGMGDFMNVLSPGLGINIVYDLDLEGARPGRWEQFRLRDIQFPYSFSRAS